LEYFQKVKKGRLCFLSTGSLGDEMDEFAIRHRDHFRSLQSEKDPDYDHTMGFMQAYMSHMKDIKKEGVIYMRELMRFYSVEGNYKLLTKEAKHVVDFVRKHNIVDLSK